MSVCVALLLTFAQPAVGQPIGEATFTVGAISAQHTDGEVRLLAKGAALFEHDVVSTGRGYAVIKLNDGTRLTVRPYTVLGLERFAHGNGDERLVIRLFAGGIRLVTGLIGERNPEGVRLETAAGTLVAHGTDIEVRVCSDDCRTETAGHTRVNRTPAVVARVVFLRGRATAASGGGKARTLALGGSLFEGDTVTTAGRSLAVMAFRDESRVTLQASTSFRIERHRHVPDAPEQNVAHLRLLSGGMRLVTGLLAAESPKAFMVATPAGSVSVEGTGFDLICQGACSSDAHAAGRSEPAPLVERLRGLLEGLLRSANAQDDLGDGLYAHVWKGRIVITSETGSTPLESGATAFLRGASALPITLTSTPAFIESNPAPRPDLAESTDPGMRGTDLFDAVEQSQPEPGLYVRVIEGDVTVQDRQGNRTDIGAGETAFGDLEHGEVVRIAADPGLVETPAPVALEDPRLEQMFQSSDVGDDPPTGLECVVE